MRLMHRINWAVLLVFWLWPAAAGAEVLPTMLPVAGSQATVATSSATTAWPLDLIIEADTYVPYFYAGRAEPVAGNTARAIAILPTAAQAASFHWQLGSQSLITNGPVATFTWPAFSRELRISVTAADSAGRTLGTMSESVSASDPKIVFYETNNLRGIYRTAIQDSLILIGSEVSVRAEPYFLGTKNLLAGATGSWSVPGAATVPGNDWRAISFTRSDDDAAHKTTATFNVQNRANLAETVSGTFTLSI